LHPLFDLFPGSLSLLLGTHDVSSSSIVVVRLDFFEKKKKTMFFGGKIEKSIRFSFRCIVHQFVRRNLTVNQLCLPTSINKFSGDHNWIVPTHIRSFL